MVAPEGTLLKTVVGILVRVPPPQTLKAMVLTREDGKGVGEISDHETDGLMLSARTCHVLPEDAGGGSYPRVSKHMQ